MNRKSKLFALAMSIFMLIACAVPASAAETLPTESSASKFVVDADGLFPISGSNVVSPCTVGDERTFSVGQAAYISNCGNAPIFELWVTGGSASTQVKFNVTSAGGTHYNDLGPVPADGSYGYYIQRAVLNGSGAWSFNAYVVEGSSAGLTCHVRQVQTRPN